MTRVSLRGIDVPAGTPDGYIPAVSGNQLQYAAPPSGGGGSTSGLTFTWGTTPVYAGVNQGDISSGSYIPEWPVEFCDAMKITEVRYDIYTAGTYWLEIDGVKVSNDVVVAAPQTLDVSFPLTAPKSVLPGGHWFKINNSVGPNRIYYKSGGAIGPQSSLMVGTGKSSVFRIDELVSANLPAARIYFLAGSPNFS